MSVLEWISDVLLLIGFAAAAAFTVDYVFIRPFRRYEPWWNTGIGWMLAMLGLSITVLGVIIVASVWLGHEYPARDVVRLCGYGLFSIAMVWLLVVYFVERNSRTLVLFKRKAKKK